MLEHDCNLICFFFLSTSGELGLDEAVKGFVADLRAPKGSTNYVIAEFDSRNYSCLTTGKTKTLLNFFKYPKNDN